MILERLDITGFGCLRDLAVQLHPRVTVIYGNNESGKSTLHRAIRAALYGVSAGGPGRPADRSDWARHLPWTPGGYGLALTYTLDDGRRIRVARRLETREQAVQVLELGGSDLTDEVRSGRSVSPGRFHLGVDEAVFCATAWLGDDGLRVDAPDSAQQRAARLQEAIERLADTRRGITATQAMERLREAIDRVGSERRGASPLGFATARLRMLDASLADVRARMAAVAGDRERLADLQSLAGTETDRWAEAERSRLSGRLADIAGRRRRLRVARADLATLTEDLETHAAFARVPTDAEAEVMSLGGQLAQATAVARESRARWTAARESIRPVRARREQIAAGVAAIGGGAPLDPEVGAAGQRLRGELVAATAAARRGIAGASRAAALRREIAATGLRQLPGALIDDLVPLLIAARRRGSAFAAIAALLAVSGGGASLLLDRAHQGRGALLVFACTLVAATACAIRAAALTGRARAARAATRDIAVSAGIDPRDLERLAARLPALRDLHAALGDEDRRDSGRRGDAEAVHAAVRDVLDRTDALAGAAGLGSRSRPAAPTVDAMIAAAEAGLDRIDAATAGSRRKQELMAEDDRLAAAEDSCLRSGEDAERADRAVTLLEARLQRLFDAVALPAPASPSAGIAAYRRACDGRRAYDEARRRLAEIQRQVRDLGGDDETLARIERSLTTQLERAGGDPGLVAASGAPDEATLQELDGAADRLRRSAASAAEMARELQARLGGVLEALPQVADLEDERDACAAARDRALGQLRALRLAGELIESASRVTHRELAPRLATSLGARLATLTGSRYVDANVDTEHFAISLLSRERPDMVPLEAVSHGTRDQVALLLRLALCEVLGGAGERAPLLLDEALVTSDPDRRTLLLEFLYELSATHQVVICTAEPALVDAAMRAAGGDCAVVRLSTPGELHADHVIATAGRHTERVRVVS